MLAKKINCIVCKLFLHHHLLLSNSHSEVSELYNKKEKAIYLNSVRRMDDEDSSHHHLGQTDEEEESTSLV